jgi:methylated-DNA-[protein]-cysteine S-methyltransferase
MRITQTNRSQNGRSRKTCHYTTLQCPLGELLLLADASALTGLYFPPQISKRDDSWTLDAEHPVLALAAVQLQEYFAGKRSNFTVSLRPFGTIFQQNIWREIARIPYGETLTYTALAERASAPRATRAAGAATGQNPIAIIIPCHRVIGKDGALCGFAGGLDRKRHLLALEKPHGRASVGRASPRDPDPSPDHILASPLPRAPLTLFYSASKSGHEKS